MSLTIRLLFKHVCSGCDLRELVEVVHISQVHCAHVNYLGLNRRLVADLTHPIRLLSFYRAAGCRLLLWCTQNSMSAHVFDHAQWQRNTSTRPTNSLPSMIWRRSHVGDYLKMYQLETLTYLAASNSIAPRFKLRGAGTLVLL